MDGRMNKLNGDMDFLVSEHGKLLESLSLMPQNKETLEGEQHYELTVLACGAAVALGVIDLMTLERLNKVVTAAYLLGRRHEAADDIPDAFKEGL